MSCADTAVVLQAELEHGRELVGTADQVCVHVCSVIGCGVFVWLMGRLWL